jgi:predicted ATP-dependent endonuclease of OLD family
MDVVVLDEPDVYLHADLQRRLMQAAMGLGCQVIVATHSSEVAAEVGSASVVWMDRSRKRSVRAPDDTLLDQIAGALGSQFNLRLARVLRARLALFVEGNDAGVLKRIARTIGAKRFAAEAGLALVPIGGVSNLRRLDGFAWLNKNLLQGAVEGCVLVDRDYHSPDFVSVMVADMKSAGLECLVWERKELESYLLVPSALARASGCSVEDIDDLLAGITQNMYEDVLFQHMATVKQDFPDKRRLADHTLGKDFRWLKEAWKDPQVRLWRCSPKDVLSELNGALQDRGKKAISVERLAGALRADEVPDEMRKLIQRLEKRLAATLRVAVS